MNRSMAPASLRIECPFRSTLSVTVNVRDAEQSRQKLQRMIYNRQ